MYRSIAELQDAYDAKKVTVTEVVIQYLNAAKKSDHNAVLTACDDRALNQAAVLDETLKRVGNVPRASQPLFGVPLGIKDVLNIDGVRTTCASKMLENYIPPYTATCVNRLEQAGAISIGKLNMDEFAMGGSNENSAYGPVKHATHPDRVPGGSSGGSATAVKAGLCVAALGTDTGGSVRQPASYSGIVGFKPTYGRISRYGLVAFASSLDQVGPMTLTVQDSAILMDVMAGFDELDSTSSVRPVATNEFSEATASPLNWNGLKVGVPQEYFVSGVQAEVSRSIQDSLEWMKAQGAELVPLSLPHTDYAVSVYYMVAVSEASSNLSRFDGVRYGVRPAEVEKAKDLSQFYKTVRSRFGAEVKRRIILGTFALSSGYYDAYYRRACQVRKLIQKDFDQAFEKVDVIVAPVAPTTAFKIGAKSDPLQMYLQDIFTIPASLAGIPALSVPCGEDQDGLPIGLHIMGKPYSDAKVLQVGSHFEKGMAAVKGGA